MPVSRLHFLMYHVSRFLPHAVAEDELRHSLGLSSHTTGKGKVALDPNTRAIEVFMCSVVSCWMPAPRALSLRSGCAYMLAMRRAFATYILLKLLAMQVQLDCDRQKCNTAHSHTWSRCQDPSECLLPAVWLVVLPQAKRMGYGDGFRWMSQYIK